MSAITGIVAVERDPGIMEQGWSLMRALQRFPADDIRVWNRDPIFLGCHAQWITPESIQERLPYYDQQRQLVITADAILDNRMELCESLQVEPARRQRITDSELILLAYCKWAEDAPKYLIGDFAFMIWDERKRRLFGARDFSGARTLYYCHDSHRFAFSTTIDPLFSLPGVEKKLNEDWLAEFLAIPSMVDAVSVESTVYQSIRQVPPSHSICVADGRVRHARYCMLPEGEVLTLKTNDEYEEAFRDVFARAITDRLRTHRQVGAHLSGGLDSGSVVSFAAPALQGLDKRLYTYSYVPIPDFQDWTPKSRLPDERPWIQAVVHHVGNITDQYCSFEDRSPLSEVDSWLDTMEMPYKFYANSFWLRGIFEEAQQQGIGVLLNGQRGNSTISWGHALDYQLALLKKGHWIRFFREFHLYGRNLGVKKSRILAVLRKKAFPQATSPDPLLIHPDFAKRTGVFERLQQHGIHLEGHSTWNEIRKNQFKHLYYWNINGTYATKLSLRYSLWDRDPTNDLRVVRFCLAVPDDQYVQAGWDRALIRRSTRGYLPDQIRLNQRLRGIQGADGVQRMAGAWTGFIKEMERVSRDSETAEWLNQSVISSALQNMKGDPQPEYIYDSNFSLLMRSLIVYRFIKKMSSKGGDKDAKASERMAKACPGSIEY